MFLYGCLRGYAQKPSGNLASLSSHTNSSSSPEHIPRAISALLQGSYWSASFSPNRIYSYSFVLAVLWCVGAYVLALAAVWVWGRRVQPERPHTRSSGATVLLWGLGRVSGMYLFLFSLLSVTTVRASGATWRDTAL